MEVFTPQSRCVLQCDAVCCSVLQCVAVCCSVLPNTRRVTWICDSQNASVRLLLQCVEAMRPLAATKTSTVTLDSSSMGVQICLFYPPSHPLLRLPLHPPLTHVISVRQKRRVKSECRGVCSSLTSHRVCCSMLQCVAVRCSVLQYSNHRTWVKSDSRGLCCSMCCNTLPRTATHCNKLQCNAAAVYLTDVTYVWCCLIPYCNTLQHTVAAQTFCLTDVTYVCCCLIPYCNTLQHTVAAQTFCLTDVTYVWQAEGGALDFATLHTLQNTEHTATHCCNSGL